MLFGRSGIVVDRIRPDTTSLFSLKADFPASENDYNICMKSLKYALVPLLLALASNAWGADQYSLALHLKVSGLTHAAPPELFGRDLIFSYEQTEPARLVGIAFASEHFSRIHPFYRNSYGVFFYVYPVSDAGETIVYRLVVDGLWMTDPSNPVEVTDDLGVARSQLTIPPEAVPVLSSPVVRGRTVRFLLTAPDGRSVYLVGDFNGWDPFVDRLEETGKHLYSITLRIPEGTHSYYFVSDGTQLADPLDPRIAYSPDGSAYSVFDVP